MEQISSWLALGELLEGHLEELFVTEGREERRIADLYEELPQALLKAPVAAVRVREPREDPGLWVLAGDREGRPSQILGRIEPARRGR